MKNWFCLRIFLFFCFPEVFKNNSEFLPFDIPKVLTVDLLSHQKLEKMFTDGKKEHA